MSSPFKAEWLVLVSLNAAAEELEHVNKSWQKGFTMPLEMFPPGAFATSQWRYSRLLGMAGEGASARQQR